MSKYRHHHRLEYWIKPYVPGTPKHSIILLNYSFRLRLSNN